MRLFSFLLMALLLAGCNKPRSVKMESVMIVDCKADYYTVQPNDTLSQIATACGQRYLDLAKLNNLEDPHILYPNQKLRLSSDVPAKNYEEKEVKVVKKSEPKSEPNKPSTLQIKPLKQAKIDSQPLEKAQVESEAIPAKTGWQWPTSRSLEYKQVKKGALHGFDVYGREGSPIYAVQNGQVVYVGDAVDRFGHLVIVKHQDDLISVYAHNQKIFVQQGQNVNAGQRLALMGDSGTTQTKLYFEIRRNGKAINPSLYLGKP